MANINAMNSNVKEENTGKNYLEDFIEKTNNRLNALESKLEVMDQVLAAILPPGARLVSVKYGDETREEVFVPLKKQ